MNASINIGIDIDVQKLLDTRLLIQASSGGGKSYLVRKISECIGNKYQQIIIDTEGEFVTLREKFNFAIASKSGDIPISIRYAETLAHKLLETKLSVIIDLYELKHHERIIFVKRFLEAMIAAPKELWHPCFVFVDESHLYCPEGAKSESASAVIDLCTRGRKRGYCAILSTQRLSKLNKDAANECFNKMIGGTAGDIDRKRAGDELSMTNKVDVLKLRGLKPGEFYAFGPAISNDVVMFKVNPVITTHLQSGKRLVETPPVPKAIKKILGSLQDIPQEAEKELSTKQELQAEVKRLSLELSKIKRGEKTVAASPALEEKVKTLRDDNIKKDSHIEELKRANAREIKKLKNSVSQIKTLKDKLVSGLGKANEILTVMDTVFDGTNAVEEIRDTYEPVKHLSTANLDMTKPSQKFNDVRVTKFKEPRPAPESNGELAKGPRAMLKVLATFNRQISRKKLSLVSGYSLTSSTFSIYINILVSGGYAMKDGNYIFITNFGFDALGDDYEKIPKGSESIIAFWKKKLDKGPSRMFAIMAENYPATMTRTELSERSGYSMTSSTFSIYINILKSLEIVSEISGAIKAADEIFS